jgi:acyl carrier protein
VQATRDQLKELVVSVLMLEGISPAEIEDDKPLFGPSGLGLDSVDALELAIHIEEQFGVKMPEDAEGKKAFTSIATLADFVAAHRTAGSA